MYCVVDVRSSSCSYSGANARNLHEFFVFYTHSYNPLAVEYLYHRLVMPYIIYLSFLSILVYYYLIKGSTSKNIIMLLSSVICIWIDGKRGLLAFLIVGILLVDFIKNQTQSNWKLVKKARYFLVCL